MNNSPNILSGPLPPLVCAFGSFCITVAAIVNELPIASGICAVFTALFIGAAVTGALTHRLIEQEREE